MNILRWSALALMISVPAVGHSAIAINFGSRDAGAAAFDAIVTSGGQTPSTLTLGSFGSGTAIALPGGITVTRNDGSFLSDQGIYTGYSLSGAFEQTTGNTIDISPYGSGKGIGAIGSGVTFSFANPVNSFGFEVGDWGTCCQPSALYMSFDDGAPIKVGESFSFGDVFETNDTSIVFVGAFDDSSSFSKVQFWGDGFGEYLVIGGTLRSANLDFGTIGDGSSFDAPLTPTSVAADGTMTFGFVARPNVPVVIDPDVAIGYTYEIESGPAGAYIATAEWEDLGDVDGYDIYDLSGNLIVSGFIPGIGNILDFRDIFENILGRTDWDELTGFEVRGIDESLGLDPNNIVAFKTSLTFGGFTAASAFQVTQKPTVTFVPGGAVPEPATWAMMIGGLAIVGASMRRRRTGTLALA
jgi:hypothetical protein